MCIKNATSIIVTFAEYNQPFLRANYRGYQILTDL